LMYWMDGVEELRSTYKYYCSGEFVTAYVRE
jgi:hypothetical protein